MGWLRVVLGDCNWGAVANRSIDPAAGDFTLRAINFLTDWLTACLRSYCLDLVFISNIHLVKKLAVIYLDMYSFSKSIKKYEEVNYQSLFIGYKRW